MNVIHLQVLAQQRVYIKRWENHRQFEVIVWNPAKNPSYGLYIRLPYDPAYPTPSCERPLIAETHGFYLVCETVCMLVIEE